MNSRFVIRGSLRWSTVISIMITVPIFIVVFVIKFSKDIGLEKTYVHSAVYSISIAFIIFVIINLAHMVIWIIYNNQKELWDRIYEEDHNIFRLIPLFPNIKEILVELEELGSDYNR